MEVRTRVRDHVPATAAALSVVSLALVFAAALRVVPAEALPRAPSAVIDAIPHLNAAVSAIALVAIIAGVRAIHRGNVERHRRLMGTAFGLFAVFLAGYLYRVALVGPTEFTAGGALETAYLAILGVHITLAVVCVPLLFYTLLLAWTHPVAEIPRTNHRRIGRIAAPLWAISFALGIVVYLLVYLVG
jgi:putative membrane protein